MVVELLNTLKSKVKVQNMKQFREFPMLFNIVFQSKSVIIRLLRILIVYIPATNDTGMYRYITLGNTKFQMY